MAVHEGDAVIGSGDGVDELRAKFKRQCAEADDKGVLNRKKLFLSRCSRNYIEVQGARETAGST